MTTAARTRRNQALAAFADRWICNEIDCRGQVASDAPGMGTFRALIDDILAFYKEAPQQNLSWQMTVTQLASDAGLAFREWREYNELSEDLFASIPTSAMTLTLARDYDNAIKRCVIDVILALSAIA